MKLRVSKSFSNRLYAQVEYIAQDKPGAARKFQTDLLEQLKAVCNLPFKHRQSIFSDDPNVRDLTFKGYTITYRIRLEKDLIEVFGLVKHQKK